MCKFLQFAQTAILEIRESHYYKVARHRTLAFALLSVIKFESRGRWRKTLKMLA